MLRNVTALLALVFLFAGTATAQTAVTVKQINELDQSQIDQLNTLGDNVTFGDLNNCGSLIYNALCGEEVSFTAVVMSDPLNSGLASVTDGIPGRIHIFVRDVAADTEGPEYMGIQVVDGSNTLGFDGLVVGDVVQIVGTVSPYNTTLQVSPSQAPVVTGSRTAGDAILDPIMITTADLNADAGADGAIRVNWDNIGKYRGNFVRFEGASALTRTSGSRVDWNWTSDGGTTSVSMYDTSLRYRNDRGGVYPDGYNVREDDFVAPTPGATVNVQGFVTFNGGTSSDPFGLAVPNGVALAVNPMDDADVVVSASPPAVNNIAVTGGIPSSQSTVTITAEIEADPARSLTGANLVFTTTSNSSETTVAGTEGADNVWSFAISSGLADGDFATFRIEASDDTGATTVSNNNSFRVLDNGVTSFAHIQQTADGLPGDSPFVGQTIAMNITATVMLSAESGMLSLQDGTGPWSGIALESVSGGSNEPAGLVDLRPGDVINITSANIEEDFGLTKLNEDNMAFTLVSSGGAMLDPVVVTTDVLADPAVAEAHEGMWIRVENAVISATNADDPSGPFGEFAINSDGDSGNGLRVDDGSGLLSYTSNDPGTVFSAGERLEYVQGALWYTYGNYKLIPLSFDDIGTVTNTDTENSELPEGFALHQNYPNPFNPTTSISFDVPNTAAITLRVFDMLGREVATLVNDQMQAGSHSVSFDASQLTSGVYMYRLSNGVDTQTRTMLLMK